jgi:plasmid stability protein
MTDLTIPNVSEATMRALRARAKETGRTVEQEAELLLSEAATQAMDRGDLLDWTRRIRAMTPEHLRKTDSTDMIRQDRDRR